MTPFRSVVRRLSLAGFIGFMGCLSPAFAATLGDFVRQHQGAMVQPPSPCKDEQGAIHGCLEFVPLGDRFPYRLMFETEQLPNGRYTVTPDALVLRIVTPRRPAYPDGEVPLSDIITDESY